MFLTWTYFLTIIGALYVVIQVFLSVGEAARRRMTVECTNGVYHDARGLLQQGLYASALEQMLRDYR